MKISGIVLVTKSQVLTSLLWFVFIYFIEGSNKFKLKISEDKDVFSAKVHEQPVVFFPFRFSSRTTSLPQCSQLTIRDLICACVYNKFSEL